MTFEDGHGAKVPPFSVGRRIGPTSRARREGAAAVEVPTHPHLGLLSLAFLSSDKFESGSLPRIQPLAVTFRPACRVCL